MQNNEIETLSAEEALEEALCFGWIDGLIKRVDEKHYIKFFSPRRAKSKWSAKNRSTAEKLMKVGRIAASGLQAIENAKRDKSCNTSGQLSLAPEDIENCAILIAAYPQASSNFQKMPPSAKRLFAGFYKAAKQESTRHRRLEKLVGLLEQNKRPML